jgi:hypothetical protein
MPIWAFVCEVMSLRCPVAAGSKQLGSQSRRAKPPCDPRRQRGIGFSCSFSPSSWVSATTVAKRVAVFPDRAASNLTRLDPCFRSSGGRALRGMQNVLEYGAEVEHCLAQVLGRLRVVSLEHGVPVPKAIRDVGMIDGYE